MNKKIPFLFALLVCLGASAIAADPAKPAPMDEKTKQQVLAHVLDTPLNQTDPVIVKAFMTIDLDKLPKKQRQRAKTRKIEIEALVKVHGVRSRKRGGMIQVSGGCPADAGMKPLEEFDTYKLAGYEEIFEDEAMKLTRETSCSEKDMSCEFSLMIFTDPARKKPRKLGLHQNDPLMALVGKYRASKGPGGQTNFFGVGSFSCKH